MVDAGVWGRAWPDRPRRATRRPGQRSGTGRGASVVRPSGSTTRSTSFQIKPKVWLVTPHEKPDRFTLPVSGPPYQKRVNPSEKTVFGYSTGYGPSNILTGHHDDSCLHSAWQGRGKTSLAPRFTTRGKPAPGAGCAIFFTNTLEFVFLRVGFGRVGMGHWIVAGKTQRRWPPIL